MREDLYALTDSGYQRVDLNEPSGIQLNFKSNMFGDLSKVTCSHSYTFKLPMTVNNRRIFDYAEDIRHQSGMIRKRITASYSQNGINLFQNANLYIESIGSSYNAVMTWDVIGGLTALKDNDISLRELPNSNVETDFGFPGTSTEVEAFDNTELVLNPIYNSGVPYYRWNIPYVKTTGRPNLSRYTGFYAYPMPVVPVYKLLQMINSHFGTSFNLGDAVTKGNAKSFNPKKEVIEKGVIPLVGKDLNYEERLQRKCYLSGIKFSYVNTKIEEENELYFPDVIQFTQVKIGAPGDYFESGSLKLSKHDRTGTNYSNVGVKPKIKNISVEFDGCIQAAFNDFPANRHDSNDEVPTLSIYQRQQVWYNDRTGGRSAYRAYYEWFELDSIDGEAIGSNGGYRIFEFDFALANGATRLSCENVKAAGGSLLFVFSHRLYRIVSMQKDIEVFLKNSDRCIVPHSMDVISNLPDIGCLAFVKSLFYMMGAFPIVTSSKEIVPRFFSEISDNLKSGNVLDWSSKLPGSASDLPTEIKFTSGDFAQRNYYLMKSDDIDSTYDPEDLDDDVYASGVGTLNVDNSTLEISSTVIQVPFFAPFILNRKIPSFDTGSTIKSWTLADEADSKERNSIYNRLEFCEPEPALGIIKERDITQELNTGEISVKGQVMTMEVWNGFSQLQTNDSYKYLQEIIRKPFVIKEDMLLTEFDLLDLDYTRPVYLDKYNSYFAIVSIQRDSNGKCKCELIKLP
ncbi:hypothetical protein [Paramuribaculum intestinale]|uniref:hypothetical protein n=1 Tax=Paramuribaculum intestinale TaxID=2094151 RepID=UPI00272F8F9B|nr:hypothetical protein [Paramuribaculum intestinale]